MSNGGPRSRNYTYAPVENKQKVVVSVCRTRKGARSFRFYGGEFKIVGDIESAVVPLEQREAIPTSHA